MGEAQIIYRLLIAIICSAAIGLERETSQKSAGLRTHMMVGVGACIFTIVSIDGFEGGDEARVAAQIVTGIGFLGAGAIFREGQMVTGLTTAAGLWTAAAIGMSAGSGSYWLAVLSTIAVLLVLFGLRGINEVVARRTRRVKDHVEVTLVEAKGLPNLLKFIKRLDSDAEQVHFKRIDDGGGVLEMAVNPDRVELLCEIIAVHKGVAKVERLAPLLWTRTEPKR